MNLTFEAWKKNFISILIEEYKISKKRACKIKNDIMKQYYSDGLSPEDAAAEESVNFSE